MESGNTSERLAEIAVIGATTGGLTLALACARLGVAVRLYDLQAAPGPRRMLELTANGTRVLHALGLKTALASISVEPAFNLIRDAGSGFLLSQRPLGAFSNARYGAPCLITSERNLNKLLVQRCEAEGVIRAGQAAVRVTPESGRVETGDGERYRHAAVAIASAADPVLLDCVAPRTVSVRPGTVLVSATAEAPLKADRQQNVQTFVGPGICSMFTPGVDSGGKPDAIELVAVGNGSAHAQPPEVWLQQSFERAGSELTRILGNVRQAIYQPALEGPVAEHWSAGRAVLLGDACQGLSVYPCYHTSAAIEDAWVLATMMERWEDEPHRGFSDYARFRKPRARRLKQAADEFLAELLNTHRSMILRRNIGWSLISRFLPEISMEKLDWLYGYDCIRGFE